MAEGGASVETAETEPRQGGLIGAWWMLAVLFALYAFSFMDRQIITIAVPAIRASLGATDFEMALVLGPAFVVIYSICSLPLGWAADFYSRRWVIFLGTVTFGLATSASGLANSISALVAARMLVGVGEASLTPAAFALIADRFPRRLFATANAIYATASKIGTASAYAIGGIFLGVLTPAALGLGEIEPWRLMFFVVGAPAIVLSFLVFTFYEPPRVKRAKSKQLLGLEAVAFLKAHAGLFTFILMGFSVVAICSFALTAWTPTYIERHFGLDPEHYGPVLGLISIAAAATLVFKGAFADWLYTRGGKAAHIRFYSWLLAGTAPFAAVMFFVRDPTIFMICYGIVQVVAMPTLVFLSTTLQLIVPAHLRGQITAVAVLCLNVVGGSLGPLSVAALTDYVFHDELMVGFSMGVVLAVAMPVAFILLRASLKGLQRIAHFDDGSGS